MSRFHPALLSLFALAPLLMAEAAAQPVAPEARCDQAATVAEQEYALPFGILAAIGRVESGRTDPATHAARPWPWTVNAAGTGSMLPTREAAIALVQALQQRGVQSIDVGCFQVNLLHHPGAFESLQSAFDPATNGLYAGRFLAALRQRSESWGAAIMAYHSADAIRGAPYRDQVLAVWNASPGGRIGNIVAVSRTHASGSEVVPVWTPHAVGSAPGLITLGRRDVHTPIIITPNS